MKKKRAAAQSIAVEQWPIDRVLPYAKNARLHPERQIEFIKASMQEFGFVNPCLVDDEGTLIAGHGRVLGAQQLGMKTVPVIQLGHLTKKKADRLRIADNAIFDAGSYDEAILRAVLEQISNDSVLAAIGFDEATLAQVLAGPGFTNAADEWSGMPEFDHQDKTAFRSVVIHFKDQTSVNKFARAIKAKITENTRYLWYPKIKIERYADKRYDSK